MGWSQAVAPWAPALPDGPLDAVLISADGREVLAAPQAVDVDLLPGHLSNARWTAITWASSEHHGKPDEVVNLTVTEVLRRAGEEHRAFIGQQTATARVSYDDMADGLSPSGDVPAREAFHGDLQSEALALDAELFEAGFTDADLG